MFRPAIETPSASTDPLRQLAMWWRDGAGWVQGHWLQIGITVVAGALIYLALALLRALAVRRARCRPEEQTVTRVLWRVIARTNALVLVIVAVRLVAAWATPPALVMDAVQLLFTVALALQAAIWVRALILGLIGLRAAEGEHETLVNAMVIIRLLVSFALFAIAIVVILANVGVNVTGLIAGLGVGGIAIGLAAQGIFADLFASLSIILDRPFRVGETIRYDGSIGTVERIGLKSTRLRSINGELLVMSNTNLLSKEIINYANLPRRRINLAIGVIYQTTPAMLRELPALLERVVTQQGHEFIRSSLTGFGASSLDFELLFDVYNSDYTAVAGARSAVGIAVFEAMGQAGYGFAYPTQTTFTAAPDGTMILPYADATTLGSPPAGR